MTSNHVPTAYQRSRRESASQHAAARQARDNGLRRVRKITWRVGLAAAAAAAFIGARFAHFTASLPNLSGGLSGDSAGAGVSSGSSSGIPGSSGVSSVPGGGVAISGGS